MDEYPLISIITPNYNFSKYIEYTINSVLNQNYPNLEYIIIDGGSTDNSVEIINKYKSRLSYFISEKDQGQTHALIKGFQRSTGDILAWLNSDDTYLPGALTFVANAYREFNFDFLYGDCYKIDTKNQILKHVKSKNTSFKAILYDHFAIPQMSSFWSRRLFDMVGGLNEKYKIIMDRAFYASVFSQKNVKIIRTNKVLSNFRIHSEQSGSRQYLVPYSIEKENLLKFYFKPNYLNKIYIKYFYRYFVRLDRVFSGSKYSIKNI